MAFEYLANVLSLDPFLLHISLLQEMDDPYIDYYYQMFSNL